MTGTPSQPVFPQNAASVKAARSALSGSGPGVRAGDDRGREETGGAGRDGEAGRAERRAGQRERDDRQPAPVDAAPDGVRPAPGARRGDRAGSRGRGPGRAGAAVRRAPTQHAGCAVRWGAYQAARSSSETASQASRRRDARTSARRHSRTVCRRQRSITTAPTSAGRAAIARPTSIDALYGADRTDSCRYLTRMPEPDPRQFRASRWRHRRPRRRRPPAPGLRAGGRDVEPRHRPQPRGAAGARRRRDRRAGSASR